MLRGAGWSAVTVTVTGPAGVAIAIAVGEHPVVCGLAIGCPVQVTTEQVRLLTSHPPHQIQLSRSGVAICNDSAGMRPTCSANRPNACSGLSLGGRSPPYPPIFASNSAVAARAASPSVPVRYGG